MPDIPLLNESALFLHVLAAIALTAAGVVQVAAGVQLRRLTAGPQIALWARFARSIGPVAAVAAALSLFTGGHLAGVAWSFSDPFVTVGTAALLLLAPVGPMIGGARLKRLAAAAEQTDHADDDLLGRRDDPVMWGALHSQVGLAVGFVWIMTNKPGWVAAIVAVAATFVIGWVAGQVAAGSSASTPSADRVAV